MPVVLRGLAWVLSGFGLGTLFGTKEEVKQYTAPMSMLEKMAWVLFFVALIGGIIFLISWFRKLFPKKA